MGKLRVLALPVAVLLVQIGSSVGPETLKPAVQPMMGSRGMGHWARAVGANGQTPLQPVSKPAGDFNGDGFADIAIGVPYEDVESMADAGAVNVVYGSATGLTSAGNQYWTQDSPGVGDSAEWSDQFGFAAAPGDFNGDGVSDLAVGVPLEDRPEDSGAVNVLYGSSSGLTSTGSQVWTQDSPGIGDHREPGDKFGWALTAGDFNHDGAWDLAVGVPFERVGKQAHAGGVQVIYGSPSGLTSAGSQFWTQNSTGIRNSADRGDLLGFSLAVSDFNGDQWVDLAIGAPGESGPLNSGAVSVVYGSSSGLASARNQFWTQDTTGIRDAAEGNDRFGYGLAAGDFDEDGHADLAVGVPFEDVGSRANAGAVNVIYGSGSGLAASRNQFWTQDTRGIRNAAEARDEFGFALAAEDFTDDGAAALAIGIPGEDPPTNGGSVAVILGGVSGLSSAGNELWSQDSLGGGPSEVWDQFGFSLAAGRYGNGPAADLAIGVPFEDVLTKKDAGAINVAYGSPQGLQPDGSQYWTQDDLVGPAEAADRFGYAVGGDPPG